MAKDHPDAPRQYGIRISDEVMEMVSTIQDCRHRKALPTALATVVEDAIEVYYDLLVKQGEIHEKQ